MKELHESWCQEVDASRYGASKDLGSPCGWDVSHGKMKNCEDIWQQQQAKSAQPLSLFTEAFGLEVEEEDSTVATQYWAEGVWTGTWRREQKEAWVRQIQEVQMWRQVRGFAGAVMFETRDLGIGELD